MARAAERGNRVEGPPAGEGAGATGPTLGVERVGASGPPAGGERAGSAVLPADPAKAVASEAPAFARVESSRFAPLLDAIGIERVARATDPGPCWLLVETETGLELRPPGESDRPGIGAGFPPDAAPRRGGTARRPALVRAFGSRIERVVDGTAGLGADAYRLAAAGHVVLAWERHPLVHALAASAWQVACEHGRVPEAVADRLRFAWGESSAALEEEPGEGLGVYLDPMYPPPRRRSALPKRALQLLRALIGEDADAATRVERARDRAARVVVKRPLHADPLAPGVDHRIATKLVRFDVYRGRAADRDGRSDRQGGTRSAVGTARADRSGASE